MHKIISLKISGISSNNKSLFNKIYLYDLKRKNYKFTTNLKTINSYLNFAQIPGLFYLFFNSKKSNTFLNLKIISITGGG